MEIKKELKEALTLLKGLLFAEAKPEDKPEDAPPAAKVAFKSKDGKDYEVVALESGSEILVKEGEAWVSPADGEVEAEDGTIITVKEGKIEAIKAPEAKPDAPKDDAPTKEQFDAVKSEFEVQKIEVASLKATIEKLSAGAGKYDATMKAMYNAIEALTNESEEKPTGTVKHSAFKVIETEKEAARKLLKEAFVAASK